MTLAKDSSMIQITYQDPRPKLAAAGANSVMNAYIAIRQSDTGGQQQMKMAEAQRQLDKAQQDRHALEDQINDLTKDVGSTDLAPQLTEIMKHRETVEFDMNMEELALKTAKAALPDAKGNRTAPAMSAQDMAQFDSTMKGMLDAQQKAHEKLDLLLARLGPMNPQVANAQLDADQADKNAKAYAAQQSARYLTTEMAPTGSTDGLHVITPAYITAQENKVASYHKILEDLQTKITSLGQINQKVQQLVTQEKRADEQIYRLQDNINALVIAGALYGQLIPQGDAIEPNQAAIDKRPQLALMGTMVGGGLPFGLMLLIGLLDSRYRYSDDTSDVGVNGLTLLGILPNLPDRLSDPGQASIAAHCVHQIRTMLQINNYGDKRAYSVTSASSGDGKTSLTLALGLSFAASGSRTLLIDSDLVGAGLTARLGMNGPEGVLEAMTTGNLMEYVKQTDVADLSILPVGLAQLHHAGIFSPQSVRKLINEAKKHYEIILVDTGPILGSIEATPVAAASDGVILTVARGQQRPLVEKALAHLNSIGARVAGVVFNRAQSRDFEQSISGISMRSASRSSNGNGNGASRAGQQRDAGQYGPVARAVASSTKKRGDDEQELRLRSTRLQAPNSKQYSIGRKWKIQNSIVLNFHSVEF